MFILINKEQGNSSFQVIAALRKITGIKKIGHAGTLDPIAEGLLIVAIGRESTRKINQFVNLDKEYLAQLCLGKKTDTYDREGKIIDEYKAKDPNLKEIQSALKYFKGEIEQVPPMYSAKKYKGKKLYELARKGIEIKRQACLINISDIEILNYRWPNLKLKVNCSKGTYIRSLVYDLGEKLKTGAYLTELKRTRIGNYNIKSAYKLSDLNSNNWQDKIIKI
jgi:tRNA pseudouridine55 synthase